MRGETISTPFRSRTNCFSKPGALSGIPVAAQTFLFALPELGQLGYAACRVGPIRLKERDWVAKENPWREEHN